MTISFVSSFQLESSLGRDVDDDDGNADDDDDDETDMACMDRRTVAEDRFN